MSNKIIFIILNKLLFIEIILIINFTQSIKFPTNFKFGVSTSAYQIEGGWNASGKGINIWDAFTHEHPELVKDHQNGDIACDSYHLWKKDVEILKDLGVNFYRFSLSWSRILPTGFTNKINSDGVNYYNKLINALIANNIEPMVTIFHWDLPQSLQDLGGWTNEKLADYFRDYTRTVFRLFGDRVKLWITINEPHSICSDTYGKGMNAPYIISPGIGEYLCGKTVLLCHAAAYKVYNEEFRNQQKGIIGITLNTEWAEPKNNNSLNRDAAERLMQMWFGWWAHPIFSKNCDYPEIMKKRIDTMSKLEKYSESRLPHLTNDEIKSLCGSSDFFGLNHYNTYLVENKDYPIDSPTSFEKDSSTLLSTNPDWKPSPDIVPWGLRKLLNWVKREYNNPLVIITENGYGTSNDSLQDEIRVTYLKLFLKAVLDAITIDDCNVKGYTYWSLMDNMEWRDGYTRKFGLYKVDFINPNRTRIPKLSSHYFHKVIKNRSIVD